MQQQQLQTTSTPGRKPRPSNLDKTIAKSRSHDIHLSTFAFLISEMVQYSNKRSANLAEFQVKLLELGRGIGVRLLELTYFRERKDKRETKHVEQLNFIKKFVWKSIYNKEADSVERHATDPLICKKTTETETSSYCIKNRLLLDYIIEKDPIINKFLPGDRGKLLSFNWLVVIW